MKRLLGLAAAGAVVTAAATRALADAPPNGNIIDNQDNS